MKRRLLIAVLAALLFPAAAHAQLDAIIDAVVDAVEPTPVYDTGLREATENLAGKIDRLNRVLFGGAEETSAAYRYRTMYSDLYEITTALTSFVERSYSNARRLEKLYMDLDGEGDSLHDYAFLVENVWASYDNTVRQGGAIVDRFKKLFSDPNTTNAEVREAARVAVEELRREEAREGRRLREETESTEIAAGLIGGEQFISASRDAFVEEGIRTYGSTLSQGGGGGVTGTIGTAVIVVIGLMSLVYVLFATIHIMRGTPHAEVNIARIFIVIVVSLVVILAIQGNI